MKIKREYSTEYSIGALTKRHRYDIMTLPQTNRLTEKVPNYRYNG